MKRRSLVLIPLSLVVPVAIGFLLIDLGDAWASGSPPPACGPSIRVVSANLLMVNPDPAPLLAELLAADADLLILQEYSSRWDRAFSDAGVAGRWPEHMSIVRDDSFGSALYSRLPLVEPEQWMLGDLPQTRARVALGSGEVEIWNVHTLPPRNREYNRLHAEQMDLLATAMEEIDTPVLLAGDLNSPAFSPFSRRVGRVLDDAWSLAGEGLGFTWPNGVFFLPPLRLDHLWLSRDLTVTHIRVGKGEHSDHRPLIADLAPREGGRLCPAQ